MDSCSTRAVQLANQIVSKHTDNPVSGEDSSSRSDLQLLCKELKVLLDSFEKLIAQQRPARSILCFRCNRSGHLQAQCRVNLNKMPRAIYCNRCGGCGHIERLCRRAAVPVAEPVAVTGCAIQINSELEILRAENTQLKAQVDELLQGKRRRRRCQVCRSRGHSGKFCPKRSGHKDLLHSPMMNVEFVNGNQSVRSQQQQRRKRQHCPARVVPSKGPLPAARVSTTMEENVLIQNPNVGDEMPVSNKEVNMGIKSGKFIPLQRGEFAQVKLLSASNEVLWSPENYVVTRTPNMAGGQYVVREAYKNGPNIRLWESDLRPSELTSWP